VEEASEHEVKVTLYKHGAYPASYSSWKKKYTDMGDVYMQHGMTVAHFKEIRRLEKENAFYHEKIIEFIGNGNYLPEHFDF
jgi:putative transposase